MRRLFLTLVFLFGLIVLAHAKSLEIPLTTTNLDQSDFVFSVSVSTNAAAKGVAFHVTITAPMEDIPSDSRTDLSIVTHTEEVDGLVHSVEPVEPAIPIALKKDKRVWEADFTAPDQLLQKPGLCFVFIKFHRAIIGGRSVAIASAEFYEIKLRDFLKR